ncbi:MAG: HAD-IA family hydrolase [Anaeromyxobacteraceae bacterium]
MRFGHLGIEVEDLFAMEQFYRAALGLELRYRYVSRNTPGLRTVMLGRDGLELELLSRPRAPAGAPARSAGHLSVAVEDVDAAFARLAALGLLGAGFEPPRDTGDGFREAMLRDPEGNVLELSARIRPPPAVPVRALIFDLDGTLVDSEPNYYLADRDLLARRGITFTEEDKARYVGGGNLDMMIDVRRRYGLPERPEALVEEKNAIYLALAERSTPVYPGMRRLLDLAREAGLRVAVASGTSPAVLSRVLEVTGLGAALPVVVSAEEVARGKPSPLIFLETARRLDVPPEACAVVEDSRPGVEAALRAFMRCIAVPYLPARPLHPTFGLADLLFEGGMETFDPDRAMAWLAGVGRSS